MTTLTARGARIAFGSLLLSFLFACTSGGGDDVSPLREPTIEPIAQAAGAPAGELTAEEGELLTFTVIASNDGPTPTLTVTGLPPGADFDPASGEFNWIPADGDAERGPFEVTFTATDPIETGLSSNQIVNITVLPFGSGTFTAIPPVIEPNGGVFLDSVTVTLSTASDGATIFYTLDGSDPTESSNQYVEPFQLTENTTVNARAFRGDLNNSNLSRAVFTVTPNELPVLDPIGNQSVIEDQNLSFTVTATDAESTPVLRVADLPPGATFDPATGEFSWTPEPGAGANSPYSVTFTAVDGDNPSLVDTETISIMVNNETPVLAAIGAQSVAETEVLSFTVSATDAETTPVLSATGLPAGATFDATTGQFSWTPAAGTASGSPYSVIFTATDAIDPSLTDSETVEITVGNDTPVLSPIGNQTTRELLGLTFTVTATDTESTPVLSSSALPPGALFAPATGVFSWIPGTGTSVGSPYSVTFTATDAVDPTLTVSETIEITVTALVLPIVATPVIEPNGGAFNDAVTVTITTATNGTSIFYTLDDNDPTQASTPYSAPFSLTQSATVNARAFQPGLGVSGRATSAPFTINVTSATCTTAITSPVVGSLLVAGDPGVQEDRADLLVTATFSCTPAIPLGWGVQLAAVGSINGASETEIERVTPYERTYSLPKDEYTVTSTVVDDLGNPVSGAAVARVTSVGIGDYYVALGDSITAGVGDGGATGRADGYPGRLERALTSALGYPHIVANEGNPGELSGGGANRINDVLAAHPDAQRVLVMYGMNDAKSLMLPIPTTGPGSFIANMQSIIDSIGADIEPVLAQVNIARSENADDAEADYYPVPDDGERSVNIKAINEAVRDLADENDLSIDPPNFYRLFLNDERYEEEYNDAIHPNGTGYQSMADLWLQEVLDP